MKRTDVHRPSVTITEDYEFQFCYDNAKPVVVGERNVWLEKARELLGEGTGHCYHCGAAIRYGAVLRHVGGEFIAVGETCLDNRFSRSTREFQALRKQAALDRQAHRIKTAVIAWLETQKEEVKAVFARHADHENFIAADIVRKTWLYGPPTEKQVALVLKVIADDAAYKVRQAEREARKAEEEARPRASAPSGRVTVTGTMLGVKTVDHDFGTTVKMLIEVQQADGIWKGWLTKPPVLDFVSGATVTVTATWTPSADDPAFAFGKRPKLIDRKEVRA